ncbi:hypothetical protein C8Q76DRAFT_618064 [Earliella scabrosa]|nr:hypothetical protein C8Q76DRAFT_618064 [Earliella scabrosa]
MPPVKGSGDKDSPDSSSDPPPKQRKRPGRVPVSCAECRRLKLRCDRKVPCETCVKRGCAALCPDGSLITGGKGTRQAVADVEELKKKIDQLQTRSNALESALRIIQAAVSDEPHPLLCDNADMPMCSSHMSSPSGSGDSPPSNDVPALTAEEEDALDAFGTLTLGPRGETRYFGQTSRSEYLIHAPERLTAHDVRFPRLSQELVKEANMELDVPCKLRDIGTEMMKLLPPLSQACQLCETFLEFGKYVWYPLPRKYVFDDVVGKVYQSWKEKEQCHVGSTHQLALMWMIYCLATLMDVNTPPYAVEAHEYYLLARLALRYAPPAHDTTVTSIQTMIYMAQYLELSDCEPAHTQSHKAWMQIGHAVKLGHSVNVSSCRWNLGEEATAQRNRVFWQLFFQDTWLSFGFGRPSSINLAFVDCEIPNDTTLEGDKREIEFHAWSWQYTRLFHTIMTTAFAAKAPSYAKIMEMDKRVRDFPVPTSLRIQCGEVEMPPPSTALIMQRMFGTLLKETTLLNLHRPYFSQALNDMPHDPLRHRYGPSVMAIYRSAWRILATARCSYKAMPVVAARLNVLWSYALAASLVMCLMVIRAPSTNLAKSALSEVDKVCDLFEDAAAKSQIASNNLSVVRKLRKQAHDATNKVHAAEDTARIHTELDRLGGKTHLICPEEDREHVCCGRVPPQPTPKPAATFSGNPFEPPVQPDMIHPTIMQDMRAFDVDALAGFGAPGSGAGMAEFNMDFPSTAFDPAQPMDFSTFDLDFGAFASGSGSGSTSSATPSVAGSINGVNGMNGVNGVNGINGMHGLNGVNGVPSPGVLGTGMGTAVSPPVLDATWQAFVEQLGF